MRVRAVRRAPRNAAGRRRCRAPSHSGTLFRGVRKFNCLVQALAVVALACSSLEPNASPGESCDRLGASRCGTTAGQELLFCDHDRRWRRGRCPGRQVCTSENGGEAACRDPVIECFNQPEGSRVCLGNEVHACSADWASSSKVSDCEGAKPVCARGECVACQPSSRRCGLSLPQLCSEQGVWEDQAACAAPTTKCVLGRCERPDTIGTECRTADDAVFEVQWTTSTTPEGATYRVRSIGGSPSAPGWTIHHRPAGVPDDYFARDQVVKDNAIIDYDVPLALMPAPNSALGPEQAPLSILTCPDGTCVASPVKSECKTVYAKPPPPAPPRPRRIAVVGDELLASNQTCADLAGSPDEAKACAPTLEDVLLGKDKPDRSKYSAWVSYQEAAGSYWWLHVVREQATTRPDVMVLAVANHDVLRILEVPDAQRLIQRQLTERAVYEAIDVVRAANAEAHVVLVTVSTRGTAEYTAEATLLNQMMWRIRDEAQFDGKILVAGWDKVAPIHCGTAWLEPNGPKCERVFLDDQIHLRPAGHELRNEFIAFAIHYAFNPLPSAASALSSESR